MISLLIINPKATRIAGRLDMITVDPKQKTDSMKIFKDIGNEMPPLTHPYLQE